MTVMNGTPHVYPPYYMENGRMYYAMRRGLQICPCDEEEMDRLDYFHALIYTHALKGHFHLAPLIRFRADPPNHLHILDLGCGSGLWAMEMGKKYPDAEVVGWDISLAVPREVYGNVRFQQRDFESPWINREGPWDLIHLSNLNGSVSDWRGMYRNVFRHLRPGEGHIELVEIDFEPRCDDGTLPIRDSWDKWYHEYLTDATERHRRPIAYNHHTENILHDCGFVDVRKVKLRLPVGEWEPSGPPGDPTELGRWYRAALTFSLEPLSLAPFTRAPYNWPFPHVKQYLRDVSDLVNRADIHAYNDLYIITARKPWPNEPR